MQFTVCESFGDGRFALISAIPQSCLLAGSFFPHQKAAKNSFLHVFAAFQFISFQRVYGKETLEHLVKGPGFFSICLELVQDGIRFIGVMNNKGLFRRTKDGGNLFRDPHDRERMI